MLEMPKSDDPKLTPEQMRGMESVLHRVVQLAAQKAGWNRTCLSCCHFDESQELCTFYKPAMRPPARVIVEACPAWAETPF
jgi:hypothetical protein